MKAIKRLWVAAVLLFIASVISLVVFATERFLHGRSEFTDWMLSNMTLAPLFSTICENLALRRELKLNE